MFKWDDNLRGVVAGGNQKSNVHMNDVILNKLPYPFSLLDVRRAKSCSGKCWIFHMSCRGNLTGYLFPSGLALHGSKSEMLQEEGWFFMECRNHSKNRRGILSAMIPKTSKLGSSEAMLTLTNGLNYCDKTNSYVMNHHTWKTEKNYGTFKNEFENQGITEEYFSLWNETSLSQKTFVYLNELFLQSNQEQRTSPLASRVQSSTLQPDAWSRKQMSSSSLFIPLQICAAKRKRNHVLYRRPKRLCGEFFKRSFIQKTESTLLYVVPHTKTFFPNNKKYMLIPLHMGDLITFVPILNTQHKWLVDEYKRNGAFTVENYRTALASFLEENSVSAIDTICIDHIRHKGGTVIACYENLDDIDSSKFTKIREPLGSIYEMILPHNPTDFELPPGLTALLRCYEWPYETCMNDRHFHMMVKTYTRKGLRRHCTEHNGNFEMLGPRCSFQSNGSLIVRPDSIQKHQYSRSSMNAAMLPYVKSIVNRLQEEAIDANYTSGESLMSLYKHILKIRNPKDLCPQTIITQSHFHNSIHRDKSSVLNNNDTAKVMDSQLLTKRDYNNVMLYVNRVRRLNEGNLPKSTTCCWTLRKNSDHLVMKQYFVGVDGKFALDLSSDILKDGKQVGSTFLSSMFNHCTSAPIWIDSKHDIHMLGPAEMYNFAWGSNGGRSSSST